MFRTLTVEEAESMLMDFHIKMPHQVIRRWLYQGLIEGKPLDKSKIDWELPEHALLPLILDPPEEYKTSEYTPEDPRIQQLSENILNELAREIAKLQQENAELLKERDELKLLLRLKETVPF